jgi:ATP adenylyltransferase
MLNRFPYQNGHVMIAPRRHTADLPVCPRRSTPDLAGDAAPHARVARRGLRSGRLQLGHESRRVRGAGVLDHLHWHIVPRWTGDTNFMPVLADIRVMPQHLLETYERLRPAFSWLHP